MGNENVNPEAEKQSVNEENSKLISQNVKLQLYNMLLRPRVTFTSEGT